MIMWLLRKFGMQNISKMVAAVVGAIFAMLVNWGMPNAFATPEIQLGFETAITALISAVFVYFFPANQKY